ncbi:hypothetical protein TYRP_015690 [Tyrophagus putrescentiae]|nr:hypothetical protein TYRP_015690 [Tyrophagus putrescentiae]
MCVLTREEKVDRFCTAVWIHSLEHHCRFPPSRLSAAMKPIRQALQHRRMQSMSSVRPMFLLRVLVTNFTPAWHSRSDSCSRQHNSERDLHSLNND